MLHMNDTYRRMLGKVMTALSVCLVAAFLSCSEDIDESNRYTFTGETIVDYLENRSDVYSSFLHILDNAYIGESSAGSIRHLLSTYGTYTCFAPTNAAVERFLFEQDSIYKDNLEKLQNGEISEKDFHDTGVHSPYLEDLSAEKCTEIAMNHLLEKGYLTVDLSEGAFPSPSMNDRFITIVWQVDEATSMVFPILNNNAKIIEADVEVENGVVQTLDAVLNPSTALLPDLVEAQKEYFAIWAKILEMTMLDSVMRHTEDKTFTRAGEAYSSPYVQKNYPGSTFLPYSKKYKYTIFLESDSIFKENGITTVEELQAECEKWYGTEDRDDPSSPRNALYKFVAYHILDRQLLYSSGTGPGGFIMENYEDNYNSEDMMYGNKYDRYDYFETKLPYTLLKVTRPLTSLEYGKEVVLNYAQNGGKKFNDSNMRKHLNVIVFSPGQAAELMPNFKYDALNGYIHPINKILIYNENEMVGNVLRERMRFDFASWFPELTNNNIRWARRSARAKVFFIPDGYCSRIKMNSEVSELYYLCGTSSWNNYQGDELLSSNLFDFEYRMPYVPAGTYELRFGYARYPNRSVVQFYVDGKPTGIPVDLRRNDITEAFIGFINDNELADETEISENDKEMHNRNWMKAPASFMVENGKNTRDTSVPMRYVLGMFYLSEGEHWFRMKNVREDQATDTQGHHDYFEIVPKAIVTDPSVPEDRY